MWRSGAVPLYRHRAGWLRGPHAQDCHFPAERWRHDCGWKVRTTFTSKRVDFLVGFYEFLTGSLSTRRFLYLRAYYVGRPEYNTSQKKTFKFFKFLPFAHFILFIKWLHIHIKFIITYQIYQRFYAKSIFSVQEKHGYCIPECTK